MWVWSICGMIWQGNTEVLGAKLILLSVHVPQIHVDCSWVEFRVVRWPEVTWWNKTRIHSNIFSYDSKYFVIQQQFQYFKYCIILLNVIFEWLELLPGIRQVSASDLVSETGCPNWGFQDLVQSLQENSGIIAISSQATTASFHILSLHYSSVFIIRRYIMRYWKSPLRCLIK